MMERKFEKTSRNPTETQITKRDYEVFRYLWKWKLLSTRAIAKKFFVQSPFSAYVRLTRLENAGYLKSVFLDNRREVVWSLTNPSYNIVRRKMVELSKDGYKSENPYHDHLATAFHLGEWLTSKADSSQLFSEQQLRRVPEEFWLKWVPRSTRHRPDGYSMYMNGVHEIIVAFEAEINLKSVDRYESVVAFYDSQTSIRLVMWLVKREGVQKSIENAFAKFGIRHLSKHHFVLLPEFLQRGWSSTVRGGEFDGRAMGTLIPYNALTTPLQYPYRSSSLELLDTQKRPVNSINSKNLKKSKNAN